MSGEDLPPAPKMSSKYEIGCLIAAGSTSEVRLSTGTGRWRYAIKVIPMKLRSGPWVMNEVKIHKGLKHPNVVRFVESFLETDTLYIVMQLSQHELLDFMEPHIGMDLTLARFYMRQLISALRYLHSKGVYHRDIKVDNLLVDRNGDLLLCDFGDARRFTSNGRRKTFRSIVGSYRYMAPEVLGGRYEGDRIDIWSSGLVLLMLCAGDLPWESPCRTDESFRSYADSPHQSLPIFRGLPEEILSLVEEMVCIDPAKRKSAEGVSRNKWLAKQTPLEESDGMCRNIKKIMSMVGGSRKYETLSQPTSTNRNITLKAERITMSQPPRNSIPLRLKQVYVSDSIRNVTEMVEAVLKKNVTKYVSHNEGSINFTVIHRGVNRLTGEIRVSDIHSHTCVTFEKRRGDVLLFRKLVSFVARQLRRSVV